MSNAARKILPESEVSEARARQWLDNLNLDKNQALKTEAFGKLLEHLHLSSVRVALLEIYRDTLPAGPPRTVLQSLIDRIRSSSDQPSSAVVASLVQPKKAIDLVSKKALDENQIYESILEDYLKRTQNQLTTQKN
ncbi:MAG: hypothetical protein KDD62_06355 [Bdellovibrionales bacterium]|nr:hypothetical protein [Bdellovibrionales bacterium]